MRTADLLVRDQGEIEPENGAAVGLLLQGDGPRHALHYESLPTATEDTA